MVVSLRWVLLCGAATFLGTTDPAGAQTAAPAPPPAAAAAKPPSPDATEVVRLYNAEKYEEALELSKRVLAKARAARDPAELIGALGNHGAVLGALARDSEADAALREALALSERVNGRDHPKTLNVLNNLAATLHRAERPSLALPLYDDLVARWMRALGTNKVGWQVWNDKLLTAVMDRAGARSDLDQGQKAADELMAVFDYVNIAIDDNDARADFLEQLADLLDDQGQLAKLGSKQPIPGPGGATVEEVPAAWFVSRSVVLSERTGSAVQRQEEVARRAYEAAGDPKNARLVGLRMPDWVMRNFDDLKAQGKTDEAFALLGESVDYLAKSCGSICLHPTLYREMLDNQSREAAAAARTDDRLSALIRIAELEARSGSAWGFGTATADAYHELADVLDGAGRAKDAELARLKAEVAEAGPDPALGKNAELQLARKLRERKRLEEADAIMLKALKCGFSSDPGFFESKLPTCESTRFAMSEYATLLTERGKKQEAEYYRLPREIADAWEGQDNAAARDKSERMLVLAGKLFAPGDTNYRQAMAYFEAVHSWYDVPLFDIPKAYRLCGRWDEPEPPKAQPTLKPGEYLPPVVSVAMPQNYSLYFGLTKKLTPLDPRQIFYHSMTNVAGNSFDKYVGQCVSAGRVAEGMRVADWAIAEANKRGYDGNERHRLMMTKAALQRAAGDTRAAEQTYQEQLEVYLSKRDTLPMGSSGDIIQALANLYAEENRTESLQALLLRMAESGLFSGNSGGQTFIRKALFELYLAKGDTEQAVQLMSSNLSPEEYDDFGERFFPGWKRLNPPAPPETDPRKAKESRQREAAYVGDYARLLQADGELQKAREMLEKEIAFNTAFLDGQYRGQGDQDDIRQKLIDTMLLNGLLYAHLSRLQYLEKDYVGALASIENTLSFSKFMIATITETVGPDAIDKLIAASRAGTIGEDQQILDLLTNSRASFAAAAEVAMRAGQTAKARDYFEQAKRLPVPAKVGLAELQVLWTSVGFGILDPSRLAAAMADARTLSGALEEQWRLRTRYPLDASATKFALQAGPQYFGDIAALAWAARDSGQTGFADAAVFEHVQRSLLDSVDMSIAGSIGRAALARTKPETVKLLDERDALASTLLANTDIKVGYDKIEVGNSEEANRDADLYNKPRQRGFDQKLSRLDAIDTQLRRDAPEYFAMTSIDPVPLAEAKALLKPNEAVLLAAPGRFGTQLMLLTSSGLEWHQSALTLDQVTAMTRRLRFSAGAEIETTPSERREWLAGVNGGYNGFDRKTANALYLELIAPFAATLQGKSELFVAGGGPLTALPFAILVSKVAPGPDDEPQVLRDTGWLGDDIALVQIPSLQSLALLRRFPTDASTAGTEFLGFGDPVLKGTAEDRGVRRGAPAPEPDVWKTTKGANVVDVNELQKLGSLPGTAKELKDMAQALGASPSSLFLEANATETQVKRAPLKGKTVLAFATHGLTTGQLGAFEPGLVLTPPAAGTPEDDGLLTASEVAGLSLDADWVILSACNTASGDGKGGAPGLSGLARAFFQAGARGLLVSHWPVRDDVAARLSVAAVKLRRDDPTLTKAEAMRRAMRAIRMNAASDGLVKNEDGDLVQMSWAHPSAWAPFSLVSDGR